MWSNWSEYWERRIAFGVTPFRKVWLEEYLPLCKGLVEKFGLRLILDVGCGTGVSGAAFTFYGAKSVLCDVDLWALKITKKLFKANPDISCVLADGFNLPFRRDSFDLAMSEGVFEHFNFASDVKLLEQMEKCSPLIMVIVPNPHSFLYKLAKVLTRTLRRKWAFGQEMERDVTESELSEMLERVHFKKEAFSTIGHTGHIATFFTVLLPRTMTGEAGRFSEENLVMTLIIRALTKVAAKLLHMPDEVYAIGVSKS